MKSYFGANIIPFGKLAKIYIKVILTLQFNLIKTNMKKLTLSLAMLCSYFGFSQGYYHGIGAQAVNSGYNLKYTTSNTGDFIHSEGGATGVPGVYYKSTYAFKEDGVSLAVSAYPFIGLDFSANTRSGASSGSFGFALPINFEMYLGDVGDGCFFVGGGFSGAYLASTSSTFGPSVGSAIGPQIALGGQFNFQGNLIGLRASYTKGLNKGNPDSSVTIIENKRYLWTIGGYYLIGR
ncbi:MAG: hypothetical protein ACI8Q1_001784 [Parvicella sp.]